MDIGALEDGRWTGSAEGKVHAFPPLLECALISMNWTALPGARTMMHGGLLLSDQPLPLPSMD
jgi:hypothetical protein